MNSGVVLVHFKCLGTQSSRVVGELLHVSPRAEETSWSSVEGRRAGTELAIGVAKVPTEPV